MSSPMEQFKIEPIIPIQVGGYDISFTNSSLFMVLAVVLATLLLAFFLRRRPAFSFPAQSVPASLVCFVVGRPR